MGTSIPRVAIVITRRKGESAETAINSLQAQTFHGFEYCVIEDIDGRGAPWARNMGWRMMNRNIEFVLFSDNDIEWKSQALETMVKILDKYPKASYCYGRYKLNGEGRSEIFSHEFFDANLLKRKNYISTMTLVRTKDLPTPPFDESLKRFQDWDLWLTMLEAGKRGIYCQDLIFETKVKPGISFDNEEMNFLDGMAVIKKKHNL